MNDDDVSMYLMPKRRLSSDREAAIVSLIDDDSPIVRQGLIDELQRMGGIGIELLTKLSRDKNRLISAQAKELLDLIKGPDSVAGFVDFIRSQRYELETGCLLLARTVDNTVDVGEVCIQIDAISARCRDLMIHPSPPFEKCKVLNRVLFHENGFRGNTEDFADPRNSLLPDVLARRKGIPITLSILYILVAQRCGLQLEPVGMPGRFLVGCFQTETPFYIDAFERGGFRTPEDLREIMRANQISPRPSFLARSPVGEVLCRCCRNLTHQYSLQGNHRRAKLFGSFVNEFEATHRRASS